MCPWHRSRSSDQDFSATWTGTNSIQQKETDMTRNTYGSLVAAAHKYNRTRRPGIFLRLAVWRLRRIDPRNPALKTASNT